MRKCAWIMGCTVLLGAQMAVAMPGGIFVPEGNSVKQALRKQGPQEPKVLSLDEMLNGARQMRECEMIASADRTIGEMRRELEATGAGDPLMTNQVSQNLRGLEEHLKNVHDMQIDAYPPAMPILVDIDWKVVVAPPPISPEETTAKALEAQKHFHEKMIREETPSAKTPQ